MNSLIKYNKQFLSPSVKLLEIQRWKRHHPLEAVCVINLKDGYSYIYEPVTTQVENPTLYQWENLHFKKEKMGNVLKIWISMFSVKMKTFLKYKNIWKKWKIELPCSKLQELETWNIILPQLLMSHLVCTWNSFSVEIK